MFDRALAHLALLSGRVLVGAVVFVLLAAAVASAQEPLPIPSNSKSIPADHVPAWVLYWAIVIAGVLGAGLCGAIKYLWTQLTTQTKEAAAAAKVSAGELKIEHDAHRASVERLKQESAEFGRECVKQLAVSTETMEELTAVTNQLLAELNNLKKTGK